MSNHKRVLAAALAAIALCATACGDSDDGSATTSTAAGTTTQAAAKHVAPKIGVLMGALFDYQQAEIDGIKEVVKREGGSYQVFNANFDPQKTTSQCNDALNSGRFNALIVGSLEPTGGIPCAQAAKAKGIPVAYIDSVLGTDPNKLEPQVDGVVGGVASLPSENAKDMVELVGQACKGIDPCQVIVEIASPTDPLTNGVVDALKGAGFDVVAKLATNFDPGEIVTKLPDVVTVNKGVDVFVGVQDATALAAVPVFAQEGLPKVKVVGNGGSRSGAAAVKSGELFATVGSWPRQSGAIVADMLVQELDGEPQTHESVDSSSVDTPRYVTKETVDQFKPEWGAGS